MMKQNEIFIALISRYLVNKAIEVTKELRSVIVLILFRNLKLFSLLMLK